MSALSGIAEGGTRERQLQRLDIFTVGDLLSHYPYRYEDRGTILPVSSTPDGEPHAYILTVITVPTVASIKRKMTVLKFRAADDSGSCEITFFNQPYLKASFPVGSRFRFYGKVTHERGTFRLSSPAFDSVGSEMKNIVPVYRRTDGLSANMLSSFIKKAYDAVASDVKDFVPLQIREKHELSTLRFAYENIHFPQDKDSLERARRRLIYNEFFLFALRLRLAHAERTGETAPCFEKVDLAPFQNVLGYELTNAQKKAVADIERDLYGRETGENIPMCRIVVGDVGCGKTAVAAVAAYITAENHRQCVLMAPTEILARQHFSELSSLFERLGMKVSLLVGSMKASEKRKSLAECLGENADRADVIIGTHALIEDNVKFADVGLVITDEQHRFGAMQRAKLTEKGGNGTHTLVMSATPIPRSLSLILYGDLDLSYIDEMPPGRQVVDTFAVDESYRPRLNEFIRRQIDEGHQVYIVCPSVSSDGEEDDSGDVPSMKAAEDHARELSENVFPDIETGFVHGKMKGSEKDSVMRDFASGKIRILVSTTVIEVGVNVPNATLMVVENAERFGLSQLHQLRGRVGRGSAKSYCVLVSKAASNAGTPAYERLLTMKREHDGMKIAEKDLALRGPGDFLPKNGSVRQSGTISFKLAELDDENGMNYLKLAFADASEILSEDPTLSSEEHRPIREKIAYSELDRESIS